MGRRPKPTNRLKKHETGPKLPPSSRASAGASHVKRGIPSAVVAVGDATRSGSGGGGGGGGVVVGGGGATIASSTDSSAVAVSTHSKPSFSEWVEQEADRRELARQQLIRQREGVFDGPIVDVLDMAEADKQTLLGLVHDGVMRVHSTTATTTTTTRSPQELGAPSNDMDRGAGGAQVEGSAGAAAGSAVAGGGGSAGDAGAAVDAVQPDEQLQAYLTTQLLFDDDQVRCFCVVVCTVSTDSQPAGRVGCGVGSACSVAWRGVARPGVAGMSGMYTCCGTNTTTLACVCLCA